MPAQFRSLRVLSTLLLLLLASTACAQATRTWVSGVGDDVNPCSRTAPCKTFAGAISKTAAGGIINALDTGSFGTLTITKAITIDASSQQSAVLASGSNGMIVNIASGVADRRVVLRGFTLDGAGAAGTVDAPLTTGLNGIRILNADSVLVENVRIQNFLNNGIEVAAATDINVVVRDTSIDRIEGPGISVATAAGTAVVDLASVSVNESETGVLAGVRSRVHGHDVRVHGARIAAFDATPSVGTSAQIALDASAATQGATGVAANGAAARVTLADTTITGNAIGISVTAGGVVASFGDNRIFANTTNGQPTEELGGQ